MADEHQLSYYNEQYGFKMVVVTKCYDEGMRYGRSRRHFYYNGKWYGWMKKFLEAIHKVQGVIRCESPRGNRSAPVRRIH